ncbi:MAG: transcriptional repressor LexA [Candidatus Omnitrophica bacterium]|jgi:repressor LexA|nr:transcriptional repressor LexA [Candidatus Omnitrophota bacterium]MDD5078238.1 transcriptional repressor LexA [Candidatus Omnitrophota bacterium]
MEDKGYLTPKQEKVLRFIRKRVGEGLPPTIREIGQEMGFKSTGTVRDYLKALIQKGLVKRMNNKSRAIELAEGAAVFNKIPIIGTINAGKPNLAYEEIQGYVDADDLFLGRLGFNDVFALRVKGDSMIDAGILEGDVAVIKKRPDAQNNDIVAALLDNNEVTLKRLRSKSGRFYLEAANVNYPPIFEEFKVIGRLITVIRKY